ncbi:MAG: lipoxygenase, partial [Algicola sp.]|nr:lipoxygenase [Algicola sp.]
SYPYRDDALDVWGAIKLWANDYLSIFYKGDAQVAADPALQNWLLDLTSKTGGCINGLGEEKNGQLGIYTLDYLVDVVTMVIFTASAQHATVNFPQLTTMSYAPAMPLATYAPPPQSTAGTPSQSMLSTLPPLEQALVQQLLGQGLGGVYFTRLGDYNRHQQGNYFSDTDVQGALAVFRDNLDAVEARIGARNLKRPYYEHLLPSRIPQSINI